MRVDFNALTGLRGVCALWIMIFHCFIFSTLQWNLEGSSIMPLFFMLSGFTLTILYADNSGLHSLISNNDDMNTLNNVSNHMGQQPQTSTNEVHDIDNWKFYRNRFARAMPLFYLTMLLAIPITVVGFGTVPPAVLAPVLILANIFPLATLSSFILGPTLNGVAWTVETLLFFWLLFPRWLRQTKQMSDVKLVREIISCYYWQCAVLIISFMLVIIVTGNFWVAFATATMNPLTRYPLFLMGMYSGMLCHRHPLNGADANAGAQVELGQIEIEASPPTNPVTVLAPNAMENPVTNLSTGNTDSSRHIVSNANPTSGNGQVSAYNSIARDTLPWPQIYLSMFPVYCFQYEHDPAGNQIPFDWPTMTRQYSLFLLVFTLIWAIVESSGVLLLGAVFLQAVVPMAQLTVIVGLTRIGDVQHSVYQFLTHHVCLTMGKYSMTIYMLHYLVMQTLTWIIYGHNLKWCDASDEDNDCTDWNDARLLPVWGIPVVVIITIPLSAIVNMSFEEPMRKLLRARN